jgi:hypothetical protein
MTPDGWAGFPRRRIRGILHGHWLHPHICRIGRPSVLVGAAEAGVFPEMIFYFTFWYKPGERAIRIAIFLCSATLSGAFGG